MRVSLRVVLAGLCLATMPGGMASATTPVAMVEDVTGTSAGVGPLDYLDAGRSIKLGRSDTLVLDYLHSCIRETITGSALIIGADQSVVHGGTVTRETVSCDGGQLQLSSEQSQTSETIVFRKKSTDTKLPPAQRTLYGLSPVFDLPGPGQLTIERLDKPADKIALSLSVADLAHHRFYDFARYNRALAGGGLYRATFGAVSLVFRLAQTAASGEAPLMARLIQL
jgi:hypothetical protein